MLERTNLLGAITAIALFISAILVFVGVGLLEGLTRHLRDNIASRIYSGTSEIQRLIIARHLGVEPQT